MGFGRGTDEKARSQGSPSKDGEMGEGLGCPAKSKQRTTMYSVQLRSTVVVTDHFS